MQARVRRTLSVGGMPFRSFANTHYGYRDYPRELTDCCELPKHRLQPLGYWIKRLTLARHYPCAALGFAKPGT